VLWTRASKGSPHVLNELLEYDNCDVDPINRLEGATPLHLAVKIEEPELRAFIVDSLLDAGADTRLGFTLILFLSFFHSYDGTHSIKDKAGSLARDYVKEDDTETVNAFLRHRVQDSILDDDVASGTPSLVVRPGHTMTNQFLIDYDEDEQQGESEDSGSDGE